MLALSAIVVLSMRVFQTDCVLAKYVTKRSSTRTSVFQSMFAREEALHEGTWANATSAFVLYHCDVCMAVVPAMQSADNVVYPLKIISRFAGKKGAINELAFRVFGPYLRSVLAEHAANYSLMDPDDVRLLFPDKE